MCQVGAMAAKEVGPGRLLTRHGFSEEGETARPPTDVSYCSLDLRACECRLSILFIVYVSPTASQYTSTHLKPDAHVPILRTSHQSVTARVPSLLYYCLLVSAPTFINVNPGSSHHCAYQSNNCLSTLLNIPKWQYDNRPKPNQLQCSFYL